MINQKARWLGSFIAALLALPMFAATTGLSASVQHTSGAAVSRALYAAPVTQGDSRTFPETGKTVRAKFLVYWNGHGGLPQQGFPISEEMQEVSDTNGQTYTVQYFERAVFELHPEFAGTPNEVLLSLLGVFFYNSKYGAAGAPGQVANNDPGSVLFPETGKRAGGKFLDYWKTHGGLAQQGFPISEEFMEKSDLNGQTYKVQYFQRAVFELHPEFAGTPNEVLLSQLGTFRYRAKYLGGGGNPTAVPPTSAVPTTVAATPTTVPATNTPAPVGTPNPCSDVPASQNAVVAPSNCAKAGSRFAFAARGFTPGENIGVYVTAPDQSVFGAPFQVKADAAGISEAVGFTTQPDFPTGIWAMTFEGVQSHNRGIAYFKLLAP